ncbi:MAG: spore coat protein [Clostridiales bacterium]|jgi:spore coat protein CotF|nr:spore coat protein [Clostridiales bacterium]
MANFSQSELNSIREVVSSHQTMSSKLSTYASQCQDPNIKQMFNQAGQDAQKSAQNLIQML